MAAELSIVNSIVDRCGGQLIPPFILLQLENMLYLSLPNKGLNPLNLNESK
jgi:hypothetical protein